MLNLMSVWIVQVGGGAPSWPSALLGAADRVGGDHPDRVRAGDSTRRCARLQRCIRRRVRANPIVLVYSSIGSGYHRREYSRIEDIEGLSSMINLCSPPAKPWDNRLFTASGASCSSGSARLNPPIFYFLSVLSRVSCDEDDDPVFEAGCGSGVLGCLIAEYQSHRLASQSRPPVDSDRQHGCLHIIWSAGNRGGVCGHCFQGTPWR